MNIIEVCLAYTPSGGVITDLYYGSHKMKGFGSRDKTEKHVYY
jgi:hypothetical protein